MSRERTRPRDQVVTLMAVASGSRRVVEQQRATSASEQNGWLPELDGLRAVACLAVVLFHAHEDWFAGTALGGMGVSLFFCLSGFLIFVLASREYARTGTLALRRFYLRRVLRIWPLYFVAIGLGILLFGAPGIVPGADAFDGMTTPEYLIRYGYAFPLFLTNLLIAFSYIGHFRWFAPDFLVVTWTIAVEEQFYAVFPFVFLWVMRANFPKWRFLVGSLLFG